jgi:hypothetical protein
LFASAHESERSFYDVYGEARYLGAAKGVDCVFGVSIVVRQLLKWSGDNPSWD